MALGSRGGVDMFFNGSLDNVAIFNKALTQTEITTLYEDYPRGR